MFQHFLSWIQKYERHLSVIAMIAGVVVDQIFFERIDLWQTQIVFATYTAICFITIPLLHWIEERKERGIKRPRWRSLLPISTQFALGGFWSGFLVFYGRSATIAGAWPFLLILVLILIGNEYFARYHTRLVFTSILFFFALYSYAIFAVPIYMGTLGISTFILSSVVAIIIFALFTVLLRILGRTRFRKDIWHIRVGAFSVLLLINFFYFTNVLPPLPLSVKAAGIYHGVKRIPGEYIATNETLPWTVQYLGFTPTLHIVGGESLYAYSSIFAPTKLTTTIVHRWQWYDPQTKQWVTKAAVAYPIVGGRDGGYRGYSASFIKKEGAWRVDIVTDDGRLIARLPFNIVYTNTPPVESTSILP